MSNSPLGQCRETILFWLGFLLQNIVRFASENAEIGVVQMVYLPPHFPDEEPPPYMSRRPKLMQVVETD